MNKRAAADPQREMSTVSGVYAKVQRRHVDVYRNAARDLIDAGHPAEAFDRAREGLSLFPGDLDLLYRCALALSRGGNVVQSHEYLERLIEGLPASRSHLKGAPRRARKLGPLEIDAYSLLGRLSKVHYERARMPAARRRHAAASAEAYERAYWLSGDPFPGINFATMSLLAGNARTSRTVAQAVLTKVGEQLRQAGSGSDPWLHATRAEALLLLGRTGECADAYAKAVALAQGKAGSIASMLRNVWLAKGALDTPLDEVMKVLRVGRVVIFSGHMIDHPSRTLQGQGARFPGAAAMEQKVAAAISDELDRLDPRFGYCSAASGSDMLFAEAMLDRGAELHVVLPFTTTDFIHTSVDFGFPELGRWRRRFETVLSKATQVHYATTEKYLGDDVLFEFANKMIQGLAITHSTELYTEAVAIVVRDRASKAATGNAMSFHRSWIESGRRAEIIELADLREDVPPEVKQGYVRSSRPRVWRQPDQLPREIMYMLFADVKNFSKLLEEQTSPFFKEFLSCVDGLIRSSRKPSFRNTWGDGLFLSFEGVTDCADFALRLLESMGKIDWKRLKLPEDTMIRIGLHAGPVFMTHNPIRQCPDLFGSHVNRAARIEPVTTPGSAFASEQFAALLAVAPAHQFICEFVGTEELAKGFDRAPLYRLSRR